MGANNSHNLPVIQKEAADEDKLLLRRSQWAFKVVRVKRHLSKRSKGSDRVRGLPECSRRKLAGLVKLARG
jgi:hypothetical protein